MQDKFEKAIALHRKGKLAEAKAIYQKILKAAPKNADALHLLGVVAAQTKDFARSVELIGRAIAIRPDDAAFHSNLGNALRALGRAAEAVESYERAVALNPRYAEALYNRGIALQALGRSEDAIESYDRALALAPNSPEVHTNRGTALREVGRLEDALGAYDMAISLRPEHVMALSNRGNVLKELGRLDDAVASYDRALALRPDYAEAWYNRGVALAALGRDGEAVVCYDRAIALRPDYAEAHYNRGVVFDRLRRWQDALAAYDRAIEFAPESIEAWCNRGNVLQELQRFAEAVESYDRALALDPDHAATITSRGNALGGLRRFDEAVACHDRALALKPDDAKAWSNRGAALAALHRMEEAFESYDRAMALDPEYFEAPWNKALALLGSGALGEGWDLYSARWKKKSFTSEPYVTTRPEWDGEPGVRLLIWEEQGIGDQILFGSMLADAAAAVSETIVQTDARLVPLFARSLPGIRFLATEEGVPEDAYDAHLAMGALGRHFRRNSEDLPAAADGYLKADTARADALRASLCGPGERLIGLSWKSKNAKFGEAKSLGLVDFLPLLRLPGVRFVNLQYGDTAAETADLRDRFGIDVQTCASVDNFSDIDGLAALIEACDFVVTTSNTTVHIAGALGKTTLMILTYGGDILWYWGNRRDGRSLWYPSVRMVAQGSLDDLPETVEELSRQAAALLRGG